MSEPAIFDKDLYSIPFVGNVRSSKFRALGILTVHDLLHHYPRSDAWILREEAPNTPLQNGQQLRLFATVKSWRSGQGKLKATLTITDSAGRDFAIKYWQTYPSWMVRDFPTRSQIIVTGVYKNSGYGSEILRAKIQAQPSLSLVTGEKNQQSSLGNQENDAQAEQSSLSQPYVSMPASTITLEPVYGATKGLSTEDISKVITRVLELVPPIPEWIPPEIIAKRQLQSYDLALRHVHKPADQNDLNRSLQRLIYDELFAVQVVLQMRRFSYASEVQGIVTEIHPGKATDEFWSKLHFKPTAEQLAATQTIDREMASPHPMKRLIQGDVGTGKTVIAAHALLRAVDAGRQGVLMVPTQVLAEQHFSTLSSMLSNIMHPVENRFLRVQLLSSAESAKEKRIVTGSTANGDCDILIATHAVLEDNIQFADLGMVVIDEQHRFGVEHRRKLSDKRPGGETPDLLIMTATPIPRSLSLTLYGDLDVSILRNRPGDNPITVQTITFGPESPRRAKLYDFIRQEVAQGRKAYVVCPFVDASEAENLADVAAAIPTHAQLQAEFDPIPVGLMHGKMPVAERESVMDAFRKGTIPILVATTVIEVGVSVDESSVMIIENAERLGLSQLHQLRGRLFRGYPDNFCVLIDGDMKPTDTVTQNPRIQAMVNSSDGFELAEIDFRLRKEGKLFSTSQSGMNDFRLADLTRNVDVVVETLQDVSYIMDKYGTPISMGKTQELSPDSTDNSTVPTNEEHLIDTCKGQESSLLTATYGPEMTAIIKEVERRHPVETWGILNAG